MPVERLLEEIRDPGYAGSLNPLYKFVNQDRLEGDRIRPSPRRVTAWIAACPENLPDKTRAHLGELLAVFLKMTALAQLVRHFAQLMAERRGAGLDSWIKQVRVAVLPEPDAFLNGLDQDHDAAVAGLTLPCSNGPTEGVNIKTKAKTTMTERQLYGRAGFTRLRHRILLA
ncbi:transposase [Streptomyces sp. NPDC056304]|uniref:transposase n=1 Tax=Streptomyces sp. NPDC056304 TaxID=3345778 RepID=UPI0035D832D8